MAPHWLVIFPLGALAAGIFLELLFSKLLSPRGKGWLAFVAGLLGLTGVLAAWPAMLRGEPIDLAFGHWDGPIQLAYHLDGLAFLFALMGTGIGLAVLLYSISYMAEEKATTRFYCLMLLFIGGFVHLVYTADLFLLYLSWELVGLCSFLLVGFWYGNPQSAFGARKVLTMTHLAGYGLLAAVVLLFVRSGSTLWTDPKVQGALTGGIFALILVSALAKSVQFPLHTWIPDAMAAPTPVSALLHAACYVKAGVYLVARLHTLAVWPGSWRFTVSWLGAGTILVGVLFAMAQHDLKRLLAFHTVSQIGYMMLGLGLGTPLGIAAGLLHCLNHGLFKGGLFMCAGSVQHACGTRDMDDLGGLARKMPRTLKVWLICAGGISGVPLLNGFVSKWLLYNAALEAHQPVLALLPWIGSVLTVFSFLKATSGTFLGSDGSATEHAHEVPHTMVLGGSLLAAGCVLIGVAPQLAVTYLVNPLLPALGCQPLTGIGWFGLSVGEGSWLASGGLILSAVALLAGLVIYWLPVASRSVVAAGGAGTFTGGEPLTVQGRLGASDFSAIVKQQLTPFFRYFDADRYWLGIWRGLSAVTSAIAARLETLERFPALLLVAFGALLSLATLAVPVQATAPQGSVPGLALLAASVAVAFAGLLLASFAVRMAWRNLAWLALAGPLACGGILASSFLARTLLLEGAAFCALLLLWKTSDRAQARSGYLAAVVLAAVGMVGGAIAAEQGNAHLALALLVTGIAIKFALVPLWFWLPMAAESTPATVVGLVVAVVDVSAFAEILTLHAVYPWLFASLPLWLGLAVASAVIGAGLAVAQRNIKRLLAFSTVEDMGMILAALVIAGTYSVSGALLGLVVHALAKGLLFAAVAAPEADGAALVNARGLANRHPVAAAGFLLGALSILGVPPTLGFLAHWRIFTTVACDPWLLAVLAAAAMLSVAVYARAVAVFWWGEAVAKDAKPHSYSRPLLAISVLLFTAALLVTGFCPGLLGGLQ